MNDMDYPYGFDARGHTAEAGSEEHIQDMIEQVLFTSPGERVNRPEFGAGLMQLVFAGNSDELAGAAQMLVSSALQQHLGDLIQLESVSVSSEESALTVRVDYVVLRNRQRETARLIRPL
jgi:phage baseplate assembly protein W